MATARERLQSINWIMNCLNEPLSRLANRQDKVRALCIGRSLPVTLPMSARCDDNANSTED